MSKQRRDWDEIGRLDALWAILSDPAKRYGRWDVDEFLATGQREVDHVLETARRWDLPQRSGRALDFGCGVGRLTRALATRFVSVVGVDVSEVMVSRARTLNADTPSCTFDLMGESGLVGYPDQSFDLIYSWIVLQHIPKRTLIEHHLLDFVRLLADGGLLVFQLPSFIPIRRQLQIRPRLYALLRRFAIPEDFLYRRLGVHPIRMNALPENTVVNLLVSAGASIIRIERSQLSDTAIEDRVYFVTVDRGTRDVADLVGAKSQPPTSTVA
jgi:trans-aconitate methyltransferase